MDVAPCRAANDAERVTQNVTAITLINNRRPGAQVPEKTVISLSVNLKNFHAQNLTSQKKKKLYVFQILLLRKSITTTF